MKDRRKRDKKKAWMVAQLRIEMTMNWAWIMKRLAMGHLRTAANAVRIQSANRNMQFLKYAIVSGGIVLLSGTVCRSQSFTNFANLNRELRANITNTAISDSMLLESIGRLGPVTEPAGFWTKIADSTNYSLSHRRRAVFALFRRHCETCGDLADLRRCVMPCSWLKHSQIEKIAFVFGNVPVEVHRGESIFSIAVLGGAKVYIRMRGDIDTEQFIADLFGREYQSKVKVDLTVMQYGYGDDYVQWIHSDQIKNPP